MKQRDKTKALELLSNKGLTLKQLQELLEVRTEKVVAINQRRRTRHFVLGIISDTHLLDKGCAIKELHEFYKLCKKRGVHHIVHAGDLLTGLGSVYKGQINDLIAYGADDHLQYVVDNYPKEQGIKTYFIAGN